MEKHHTYEVPLHLLNLDFDGAEGLAQKLALLRHW